VIHLAAVLIPDREELVALAGSSPAGDPVRAAANGIPMTRGQRYQEDATIDSAANTTLSYKYDLGGSWNNVEKDADCADIGNRTMSVNGGTVSGCGYVGNRNFGFNTADATYTANDTVANW